MIKNYIKVAFRNLMRNKVYSLINIGGLSVGLAVTLLIFMFVRNELSYEKHYDGYDRIYRTAIDANMMGMKMKAAVSCSPQAYTLRTEFPEVEAATRIKEIRQEIMMAHNQNKIYVAKGCEADSSFFKVFEIKLLEGDPKTALTQVNSVVISQALKKKFFGNEPALGKILRYDDRRDCLVTGVMEPPRGLSHFQFDMYISDNEVTHRWFSNSWRTYLKLKEGVDETVFERDMQKVFAKHIEPEVKQILGKTIEEFSAAGNTFDNLLQPLAAIHLTSNTQWEIEQNGNIMYIYIFLAIAWLVIIIAGINFMNLATARSAKRAKEVGIRKVAGATRKMLIFQFLIEAILQSFIALLFALVWLELVLPVFNNLMDTKLYFFGGNFWGILGFALLVTSFIGLFSGSYPAFFLSSFEPAKVLKGDLSKSKSGGLFRKSLVVVQFASSVILIIGMLIVFEQINYMHNKDLGFEAEQVIVIPLQTDKMVADFNVVKKELLTNPNIMAVTRSSYLPGSTPNQNMFKLEGQDDDLPFWNMEVDFDFTKTLSLEIVEGRDFSVDHPSDTAQKYIVNQTALEKFNITNPIGKRIGRYNNNSGLKYGEIIGVVKDFHIEDFSQPIRPMIFTYDKNLWFASIKLSGNDIKTTLDYINEKWTEFEPSHPMRYTFLREDFGKLFKTQENFGRIFLYLTILAIFIAALGLFGLASFTAEQRTKEIGVRKVLGATISQLMLLLTKDFIKLVLIANLIAWPITFYLSRDWLSGFSYQIDMPLLPYILALLMAVVITLITVSSQAFKAATSDPVKALKYE